MAKAIVHCRACGEAFDRNSTLLKEGIDWVKPANKIYYHKQCYEEYKRNKDDINSTMSETAWFEATWEFLTKEIKVPVDFHKVRSQWNNFLQKKMTAKGMYFALRYFYEIKKNDVTKSENGIGIIPHIYQESCTYWQDREAHDAGICEAIERQIRQAQKQETVVVNRRKKSKKTITAAERLAAIMNMEDEE